MTGENRSERAITIDGYDHLATRRETLERWESPWADSPYQKYYVWPAIRRMLPDVSELDVLDAGCGIGDYTGALLERGASVVGVDTSENALATARERFGDRATFHRQDLTEPLAFASAGRFDLVFCNLVLDHIEDWGPVFSEFQRVLTPGGEVVFTTIHPMRRYRRHRDELTSYYETEAYVSEWGTTDARIASYHRPVEAILESLTEAGFSVDEFREAIPQDEFEEYDPERYETAMERPDTLCVRARATSTEY